MAIEPGSSAEKRKSLALEAFKDFPGKIAQVAQRRQDARRRPAVKRLLHTLIVCALVVLPVCLPAGTHAAFPIVDSGAWVLSGGNRTIYWLDDQRVLFIGHELIKPMSDREADPALLLWEIGKAVTIVRRHVLSLCYRPGQIMYSVLDKQAKKRAFYQGEMGREVEVQPVRTDGVNCDATYQPPDRSQNRAIGPLLRGHGYLYLGPILGKESLENDPVIHFGEGSEKGTQLPFGRGEYLYADYYSFRGAYLMHLNYFDPVRKYGTTTWPASEKKKAYWLWPDGRTEKIEIPSDIDGIYPAKAGLVYRVFGTRTKKDGLYFHLPSGERKLIASGFVTQLAISPDGCRVAFSYAPEERSDARRPDNRRTIKASNLCEGE
jgi:hypothetical protein